MNSRRWIIVTLATILGVAAVDIAVAYMVDPYGVWRNPAGRQLPVALITNGRKAKFLMSKRYIPANFDGLIIGASSLANWNISTLASAQIYNLSIDGGNATEQKLVVDQALGRGHYKLVIFALGPINTSSHEVKGGLDETTTTEALASFHLFIQELAYALRAAHHGAGYVDIAPNGHYNYSVKRKGLEPIDLAPSYFHIDSVALQQYRAMISNLQNQGAVIVYVVPPLYEPFYELHKASYEGYLKTILPLLPDAPVIDFQGPEYTALRSDPNNFLDVNHTEPQGAEKFSALLNELVSRAIATQK
jgi:hypothetical protein